MISYSGKISGFSATKKNKIEIRFMAVTLDYLTRVLNVHLQAIKLRHLFKYTVEYNICSQKNNST